MAADERETLTALFIEVEVDGSIAERRRARGEARRGLPGRHLRRRRRAASRSSTENLDECVLCELCLEAAPDGAVRVKKLYDGTELRR